MRTQMTEICLKDFLGTKRPYLIRIKKTYSYNETQNINRNNLSASKTDITIINELRD